MRDNLQMGRPDADDAAIWAALEQVRLANFLRGEQGLDTRLTEKGGNLSGGQCQRLALPRALLHDSPVYIFDEATSNIDMESENDIMERIHALAKKKTVIFKLLALIRDKVFLALRRLCPAKLEGRDKGDLISVVTSDIELLEVFYAHTISPAAIALLFTGILCGWIGSYHWALGLLALAAYLVVGIAVPLAVSRASGDDGLRFRTESGELSAFLLDSLRGLPELLQYGHGEQRLASLNAQTVALSGDEERMKRIAGRNSAVTGMIILLSAVCNSLTAFHRAYPSVEMFPRRTLCKSTLPSLPI